MSASHPIAGSWGCCCHLFTKIGFMCEHLGPGAIFCSTDSIPILWLSQMGNCCSRVWLCGISLVVTRSQSLKQGPRHPAVNAPHNQLHSKICFTTSLKSQSPYKSGRVLASFSHFHLTLLGQVSLPVVTVTLLWVPKRGEGIHASRVPSSRSYKCGSYSQLWKCV